MKNYVKPELFYESYELSQSIAACAWDMNQADPASCTAIGDPSFGNPDVPVFAVKDICGDLIVEDYCYENGADTPNIKIFAS